MNSKILEALIILDNMYIHNKSLSLYHVSPNGSLKELSPRYSAKPLKGEDNSIKRISAAPTVDGCFRGVGYDIKPGGKPIKYYIYKLILTNSTKIIRPTAKMVPDRDLSDEYWVLDPVKVKSLGYITISLDPKTNKYHFDNSNVSESLIPVNEGFFNTSKNISDREIKNSPYYTMTDKELASYLVDNLYNNQMIKLASKSDPMVTNRLNIMRFTANYYFEYFIDGVPVAVTKGNKNDKESSFTVFAYVPKTSKAARGIGYTRTELIKKLIMNNW